MRCVSGRLKIYYKWPVWGGAGYAQGAQKGRFKGKNAEGREGGNSMEGCGKRAACFRKKGSLRRPCKTRPCEGQIDPWTGCGCFICP